MCVPLLTVCMLFSSCLCSGFFGATPDAYGALCLVLHCAAPLDERKSLIRHNSTSTIVFPSTLRDTRVVVTKRNATSVGMLINALQSEQRYYIVVFTAIPTSEVLFPLSNNTALLQTIPRCCKCSNT